jgi:hypothetical protein
MRKGQWNTYRTVGFTVQNGPNRAASGGVTHLQVRKGRAGWMGRRVDSNGRHESHGPAHTLDEAEGEARYAEAVADFEQAANKAPAEVDEPTAAAALDVFLDRWGHVFENEQADVNGGDLVEWVGEWLPTVFAATRTKPAPVVVVMDGGIVTNVYGPDVHVVVVDWDRMPGEQAGTFPVQPSSEMGKETAEVVARALTEEGVQA